MAKRRVYVLHEGMGLAKKYKGRPYSLRVVRNSGKLQFWLGSMMLRALTAAAKYVRGAQHEIYDPRFWGAPPA